MHNVNIRIFSNFLKSFEKHEKNNSRVNNRFGMNQQNSSEQHSPGDEGKKKTERKGAPDTNPFHEVSNSSHGFHDSRPIGKKEPRQDDFVQTDVKIR